MKPRIAIVGGGITGVAVAYELSRRGHTNFTLFEASSRLGGIVETHRQDGFVIEGGPDSWVSEKPWARELAIELGLGDEIIPSNDAHRRTYLLEGDHLAPMPDGMRMMVPSDLDAIEKSPLISEEAKRGYREEQARAEQLKSFAAARAPEDDESVASFVQRHFGNEVAQKIAWPLLAGVFGGEIQQLSAAAVMAPFLRMEREHGSLIVGLQEQKRRGTTGSSVFTTLKSGLESLIEGMAQVVPASAVRLAEPVEALGRKSGEWEVVTPVGAASFDHVVIATPVHVARELVSPWHPELAGLLNVEATSAVVAAFAFDREASAKFAVPEGFGFLVPQQHSPDGEPELLAATFVNQKFSYRAPEGCILLRAFFGGNAAPALLPMPDEFIVQLALRRLSRVLGQLPPPHIALVRRWPLSLPQYTIGHLARVARIESLADEIPGFHLLGNAFHGVGLPDLVRMGRSVGATLASC